LVSNKILLFFWLNVFFHAQEKTLVFIKKFLEKKSSLNHLILEKKKETKKNIPTPCLQQPHPPTPKKQFFENKKNPSSYLEKQSNFSLPGHSRNNLLG
jgi:hypothetical protein